MSSAQQSDSTDLTLLKRVQGGDRTAWICFEKVYGPLLLYWCQRGGVDRNDCPDVCQDVFLRTGKAIAGFVKARPEDSLRGWLFTITRNRIADYHRARKRRAEVPLAGELPWLDRLARLDEEEASPEPPSQKLFARAALDSIRGEFTENTWQAYLLHGIENLRAAEVAGRLAMTAQAVRAAKARVLRRLRAEFGDVL